MGRKRDPEAWVLWHCKHCNAERTIRRCSKQQYCSRSCKNKWEHANGLRKVGFDPHKPWLSYVVEKHGVEVAQQRDLEHRQALSESIRNADMSHQKEVARALRVALNVSHTGKTLEDIYGVERGKEMREKRSLNTRGKNNPAYGKSYMNGGKSVKGYYKGRFFRSLLEYSFMKHLENEGVSLDNVGYECFTIPYVFDGSDRTYRIDFYVRARATVYEVKPSYVFKKLKPIDDAKWQAAREYFKLCAIDFKVVSEFDFTKITFDIARQDVDVVWKEDTFKYFRGS